MTDATGITAVVAGYLSLDHLETPAGTFENVPGGGALYGSLASSAAGALTHLVAARPADFPQSALDALEQAGISLVYLTEGGIARRSRLVEPDTTSRRLTPAHAEEAWWERTNALAPQLPDGVRADVFILTPMPVAAAWKAVEIARSVGARVVLDTSEAFASEECAALLVLIGHVDVFAPSRAEIVLLTGTRDEERARRELAARCPVLIEKRGADGARLSVNGDVLSDQPSRAYAIRDATGAGDALVATFAVLNTAGVGPEAALTAGLDAAARAASAVGPSAYGVSLAQRGDL